MAAGDAQRSLLTSWGGGVREGFLEEEVVAGF